MRLSFTALETFKLCPQKYKFREIDRVKEPPSAQRAFGTLVHDALYYLHSQEPIFPTLEELLNYYKDNWPGKEKANWKDERQEQMYFAQGLGMLTKYYNNTDRTVSTVVDLETRFEVPLHEGSEPHLITGKIDRIDKISSDAYEIIDYKTTRRMPGQSEVDENMQLALYHMGLKKRWPHIKPENIKLSLYYLRHGEKLSTARTEEKLKETVQNLEGTIKEIQQSDFKPRPGPHCDHCGYKSVCPAWKHLYCPQEAPGDKEAQEAIDEYLNIKKQSQQDNKRVAELQRIIGSYCNANNMDRVFGSDGSVISRSLLSRYEYDQDKLKEVLEPLGYWDTIQGLNDDKFKELLKSLPQDIKQKIDQAKKLIKQSPTFRVSFKKPQGQPPKINSDLFI